MTRAVPLLCLLLVGCTPKVEMVTPGAVVVSNVTRKTVAEALAIAEAACAETGKHAVPIPDNVRDGNQTYECK